MGNKLVFDYFFGKESEMFSFYRIPRMLIKDPNFSHLSCEAKLLYGLMLDRMALSQRNGWHDDDNRTYIIYTIDEAAADLNCGRGKAIRVMAELDSTSGIGLIEKIRRGLGKPDIIYVKNFVGVVAEQTRETADEFAEVPKSNFKKSQNQICRSSKIELQEVPEKDFKKSQDKTSRSSNMTPQEVSLWDSNYTYKSNTYENYTNLINPSDDSNRALSCKADVMDEMENIRVFFAMLHFSLGSVMYGFMYGCIFALVRVATGNLIYSVAMHGVFNMVNVAMAYIGITMVPGWIVLLAFSAGLAGFIILLIVFFKKNPVSLSKSSFKRRQLITREGYITLIICLCVTVMLLMM